MHDYNESARNNNLARTLRTPAVAQDNLAKVSIQEIFKKLIKIWKGKRKLENLYVNFKGSAHKLRVFLLLVIMHFWRGKTLT